MKYTSSTINKIVPFAVEASWASSRWETMEKYLRLYNAGNVTEVFNLGIGQALLSFKTGDSKVLSEHLQIVRETVAASLTQTTTSSLHAAHDAMLKCHVLSDLEMISNNMLRGDGDQQAVLTALGRRLEVLGAVVGDKQYLLSIHRAAMSLMQ
jgi:serine/threonine-protein kinase ATR